MSPWLCWLAASLARLVQVEGSMGHLAPMNSTLSRQKGEQDEAMVLAPVVGGLSVLCVISNLSIMCPTLCMC